jgi:hypothetical protein
VSTLTPGIYPGVPMADYLSWPAVSNSGLTRMLKSPAHYRAYVDGPPSEPSPAMRLGSAVHMAILEPDKFADTYHPEPQIEGYANPRGTKSYKAAVQQIEAEGFTVLREEDMTAVAAITEAAHAHPRLVKVITATGTAELSICWSDPDTGVTCKGRIDWHTPTTAGGAILDLKTTKDASPSSFERAIYQFGYHRQAALYLRGAKELDLPVKHYTIAAIETAPPYGVVLYRLDDEAIRLGEVQVDFALGLYAECRRTGVWNGYTTDVVEIGLPAWADKAIERDLEEVAA